jgi:hypothetical protein
LSKLTRTVFAVSVAALAAGGIASWLIQGAGSAAAPCFYSLATPRVYAVALKERSEGSAAVELHGELLLRPVAASSSEAAARDLVGVFTPKLYRAQGEEHETFVGFDRSFVVKIAADCRIDRIDFDGQQTFAARESVLKVLTVLDFAPRARATTGTEIVLRDFLGESVFTKDLDDGETLRLTRRRILSPPPAPAGETWLPPTPAVRRSAFVFRGEAQAPWPHEMEASETVEIPASGRGPRRVMSYEITLRGRQVGAAAASAAAAAAGPVAGARVVSKQVGDVFRGRDRPSVYDSLESSVSSGGSLDATLQTFADVLPHDPVNAKKALIAFLRANPAALAQLREMIAAEEFSDFVLVHLLFAIAKTGSSEAQAAMAALIDDDALSSSTRLRVLFAVAELPLAESVVVEAVRAHALRAWDGSGDADELASTALLTAGILARNAVDVSPEVERQLRDELEGLLSRSRDPTQRAGVIDAIANYGNAALGASVAAYLGSPHDVERAAAAEALRNLPLPERETLLGDLLSAEPVPVVRGAALKTLATVGITAPRLVERVAGVLRQEPESANRVSAVQVLGKAASTMPEARTALTTHLAVERDVHVIEAAGRYLSAYEVAASRR